MFKSWGVLPLGTVLGTSLIVPAAGFCQDPLPQVQPYHIRAFTVEDGLAASDVTAIGQDQDGFLYVGGGRGVMRFDGYGFEEVPLEGFATRHITRIRGDDAGRLWIESQGGDLAYIKDGSVRVLPRAPAQILGLPRSSDEQMVWLGTDRGLLQFDPRAGAYRIFNSDHGLPSDTVVGLVEMDDGRHVAVTMGGLAWFGMDGDASGPRAIPVGEPFRLMSPVATGALYRDRTGLWLRTTRGILRFSSGELRASPPPEQNRRSGPGTLETVGSGSPTLGDSLFSDAGEPIRGWVVELLGAESDLPFVSPGARIQTLRGKDGTRWTTVRDVVQRRSRLLVKRRDRYEIVPLDEHLDLRAISSLFRDHEGNVWVGTDLGLVQISLRGVGALTDGHGLSEGFTTAVLQSQDGAVWVGTWGGGLHRFAGGRLDRRFTVAEGLFGNRIRTLFEAKDGSLWVGGRTGISRLQAVDDHALRISGPWRPGDRSEVRSFAETFASDGSPRLWVAFGPDLLLGREGEGGSKYSFLPFRPDLKWEHRIWALHAARDGSLWVGAEGALLQVVGDSVRRFGKEDGLRSLHISSIQEEEDGTLWIGTYAHGLHRYRGNRFVPVTTAEGLHHDGIWRMLEDAGGHVWMSSDGGISRVSSERLHGVADAVQRRKRPADLLDPLVFREDEGMPSRETNRASPAGWHLADGRLVFNNIAGLVVIDPEQAVKSPRPPPTHLRSVTVDGSVVPRDTAALPRFPRGARHVIFEFSALSYTNPEQNRYRYRLDGYDEGWVEGGTFRRATYTGLRPGSYTFHVQGATGTGDWSSQGASYPFVVPALFWQTWWFRGLLVALVAGVVLAAHRYRLRRMLEMERLRLRIASDLHDDVGSNLSSIALLSEMLRDRVELEGLEGRQLERIRLAATETIGSLREIIWLVDPRKDTLPDLIQRMRRTAMELLNGVPCVFRVEVPERARPLDPVFARQVFLIHKEALHNISRHARAAQVRIQISVRDQDFILSLEDDGQGFDFEDLDRGYGLDSMRNRANDLGGEIEIQSAPGRGTRVTLRADMA